MGAFTPSLVRISIGGKFKPSESPQGEKKAKAKDAEIEIFIEDSNGTADQQIKVLEAAIKHIKADAAAKKKAAEPLVERQKSIAAKRAKKKAATAKVVKKRLAGS